MSCTLSLYFLRAGRPHYSVDFYQLKNAVRLGVSKALIFSLWCAYIM